MKEALTISAPAPPADRRARRRSAIFAAARRLFLDKGFDAVSMGEIVRVSGGSLSTLYELFESKEGVLAAIVADEQRHTRTLLQALADREAPPRETLTLLINDLQAEFFHADMIGMFRLVMTESLRNVKLSRLLHDSAFTPFDHLLADLFRQWTIKGQARIDNPEVAADLLIGMLLHPRVKHACCNTENPREIDVAAIADAAIAMFTHYYGIA